MEGLKRQDSENLILLQVFELVWLCSLTWSYGNCCILVGERSQERLQVNLELCVSSVVCVLVVKYLLAEEIANWRNFFLVEGKWVCIGFFLLVCLSLGCLFALCFAGFCLVVLYFF